MSPFPSLDGQARTVMLRSLRFLGEDANKFISRQQQLLPPYFIHLPLLSLPGHGGEEQQKGQQIGKQKLQTGEIISMKQSFLQELKNIRTVTVKDLQGQLKKSPHNRMNSCNMVNGDQHPSDLKIISPFYDRINHKPDCRCKYHRRQLREVPKVKRMRTEPNEPVMANIRLTEVKEGEEEKQEEGGMENLFEDWRLKLSSDDLKKYYFQYLKQLPNINKFKRMDKLDCHNTAFEEFLKNNYLVILEKKEEKPKDKETAVVHKSSQRLNKVYTEGNIDLQALSQCNFRRELVSYKENVSRTYQSETNYDQSTSKDTIKLKKIGIKGTGKTLQLIDEQQIKSRKEDNRRKKVKYINSRPSFFGLIEDQELLKQLCMKLMNDNKRANKEAEMMVRQLVDSDVDMYQKMIGELQEDIEVGIKLRNLDEEEANVLIKIVLNKIQRQTQQIKLKDHNYEHKRSLIEDLCNKYGWKEDNIIQLKQFWKMRQEKQSSTNTYSRNSIYNSQSKGKISKGNINIDSKEAKKIKSKVKIKEDPRMSRMSGFHSEKKSQQHLNQNSVKFVNGEKLEKLEESSGKEEERKFITPRTMSKMGVFKSKAKKTVVVPTPPEPQFRSSLHPRRAFASNFRPHMARDDDIHLHLQEIDDVVIEMQTMKEIDEPNKGDNSDSRNSSLYLSLQSHVQRHIEINKRFLKRIQHNLIDNECERLIIGMGEGIITKKRKIRAIHAALRTEEIKKSEYYGDILKYLEIYEDYCDLVVKTRRQKKARIDVAAQRQVHEGKEKLREEEEMDICTLLNSLSNERELKYMDLTLLSEDEDPKQELILKIPQYITQVERKPKRTKKISMENLNESESEPTERVRQQFGVLQKNLEERVTVECKNNWPHEDEPIPSQSPRNRPSVLFQSKLQGYRHNLLKKE